MPKNAVSIKPTRLHINVHPFILSEVDSVCEKTGMTYTTFFERAAQDKLSEWGLDPFSDENLKKRLSDLRPNYDAPKGNTKEEVKKHLRAAKSAIRQ